MSASAEIPSDRSLPAESERFRLARLARDAALQVIGVVGTDAGPSGMFITVDGAQRLEGVLCVASQPGGYDITLGLVCKMVPLMALSQQVQAAVKRVADRAEIRLDDVSVHIAAINEIGSR